MPYQSFAAGLSLLIPALSPLVLAAAEAKVDENGEGIARNCLWCWNPGWAIRSDLRGIEDEKRYLSACRVEEEWIA